MTRHWRQGRCSRSVWDRRPSSLHCRLRWCKRNQMTTVPLKYACWRLYNVRARSSCWPQDTRSSRNICEPNVFTWRQRTEWTCGVAPVVILRLSASSKRVSLVELCPWRRSRDQSLLKLRHGGLQSSPHQKLRWAPSTYSRGVAIDEQGQVGILRLGQQVLHCPHHAFSLSVCLRVPGAAGYVMEAVTSSEGGEVS